MIKRTLFLALAGASVIPVFAQSSVTLYGITDMGLNHTSNKDGSSLVELRSGNSMASRFGFRGVEDLGGGLSAIFRLESGVNVDTGTSANANQFFNRQSWVGLSSSLGQVTMGVQLPTFNDVFTDTSNATIFSSQAAAVDGGALAAGTSAARFNNYIGGLRVSNAIKFRSANFGGLQVLGMAALGEKSATQGNIYSLGAIYGMGSYELGFAYQSQACGHGIDCSGGQARDTVTGLGAAYKWAGGGRLGTYVTRQKNSKNRSGVDADTLTLLLLYPVNQWTFGVGYQMLKDRTELKQDIQQVNLQAKYALSKRTELYAQLSHQRVDGDGKAGMFLRASTTNKQTQTNFGVRHSF